MASDNEVLQLTEDLIIGVGNHKTAYKHPSDSTLCVKLIHSEPDPDIDRELELREKCKKRLANSILLPKYYGIVQPNLGRGYVFEMIRDYDGGGSRSLEDILRDKAAGKDVAFDVMELLLDFKKNWFSECVAVSNTDSKNYILQVLAPGKAVLKIIDNIGTSVKIPLAYYFDYFAKKRAERYWLRFVKQLHREYPTIITDKEVQLLLK